MPLYKTATINKNIRLAIWKIDESERFLLDSIHLSERDNALFSAIKHPDKRLEFLAGRNLIKHAFAALGIQQQQVFRNKYGKPELETDHIQLSLSHTAAYVTLLIGNNINVGIDIEMPQPKMEKVAQRLFNKEELALCDGSLSNFCKVWSAKEVLFKLYMKGGINFKEHLFVSSKDNFETCEGTVTKDGYARNYQMKFLNLDNYFICFNIN